MADKRLIDANAADVEGISCYYGSRCYTDDVQEWLNEQPTVDAVPVVHGHWAWDTEDIYKCTNCGEKSHVKEVMGKPDWNYCPNCGAKMDGERSEGE